MNAAPGTASASDSVDDLIGHSSSESLRVLFVTTLYAPYVGGVETHVREVARRTAAAGHQATVLTTDPTGNLPLTERSDGVEIIRVRSWPRKRDYYFAPGIYRTIAGGGWDIVHCQGYHNLVPPTAMLAAARSRIPYVLTFHSGGHSSRLRNALRGGQRAFLRPFLARAERLIAVSNFEADFFRRHLRLPAESFTVIPNGSDLPARPLVGTRNGDNGLIVSIGRLERYKGHHRLIAALPRIAQVRPDAHLRIVGSGPYRKPLQDLAVRLGVADRVEIGAVNSTDREGMSDILAQAALVTLLSEYEAHPIAVMEALSMRRPVLVTYAGGLAELADRGLVRSVPLNGSTADVADAVLYNLQHPLIPRGVDFQTWDDCAAQLLALYTTVVRGVRCAS